MKIVHFESGLGNQMLCYAEYLAIKYNYDDVYSEKLIYETLPKNKGICQWNGYELDKVFNLNIPDIKNILSNNEISFVKSELINSKYWKNDWKYAEPICNALNKLGYNIQNYCWHGSHNVDDKKNKKIIIKILKKLFFSSRFGNWLYRIICKIFETKMIKNKYVNLYIKDEQNFYCGQSLRFMYKDENIELIEKQLRSSFIFQNISIQNLNFLNKMKDYNTVSIHARRGDFLSINSFCYKYGYFKRATKFIKKHVEQPFFIFFCDTGSISWIKKNLKVFGLKSTDKYIFVDWNKGENSYEDMFLMSKCKHNIITQSSFGWWGSWLNENPNKITISPDCRINTTKWM